MRVEGCQKPNKAGGGKFDRAVSTTSVQLLLSVSNYAAVNNVSLHLFFMCGESFFAASSLETGMYLRKLRSVLCAVIFITSSTAHKEPSLLRGLFHLFSLTLLISAGVICVAGPIVRTVCANTCAATIQPTVGGIHTGTRLVYWCCSC